MNGNIKPPTAELLCQCLEDLDAGGTDELLRQKEKKGFDRFAHQRQPSYAARAQWFDRLTQNQRNFRPSAACWAPKGGPKGELSR